MGRTWIKYKQYFHFVPIFAMIVGMLKGFIQKRLENYVRAYFAKHPEVRLVIVTGSVGKTSTKTNIARMLSQKLRVRMQAGNHNTEMSAPLGILGIDYPENVRSILSWLAVFRATKKRINDPADVDVIVQELGSEHPGEIPHFGTYLRPYLAVVTGVTPEHMEFFGSIEKVAEEELTAINFSENGLINRDDIDGRFASFITNANIDTYGTTSAAEYRFEIDDFSLEHGYSGYVVSSDFPETIEATIRVVGEHSLRPVIASVVVGLKFGLSAEEIAAGLGAVEPVAGRMNILRGQDESILIDDTYNSSPAAAEAALRTLYGLDAPQRIAVLGSMNELGADSQLEHEKLGDLCDPNLLAWVITVGDEANRFLAPRARARGCQVKSFISPLDAGAFVHSVLEKDSVVLLKGSQGNIYLEEATKMLLHSTDDDRWLVRQSQQWMKIKNDFFSKTSSDT